MLENIKELSKELSMRGQQFDFDHTRGLTLLDIAGYDLNSDDNQTIISKIAHVLTAEINLYKNQFKGQLLEYIDNCKNAMSDTTEIPVSGRFKIVEVDLPTICKDSKELNLFKEKLTLSALSNYDDIPKIPVLEIETIELENKILNRYVKEMFTEHDMKNLGKYFSMMTEPFRPEETIFYAEDLVKTWILANYVLESKIKESGIKQQAIKNIIWKLETYISQAIESYDNYLKIEKLFLKIEKLEDDPEVYVLKPVYDNCDNEIGLVEALFGLAIKDKNKIVGGDYIKGNIISKKPELIKLWELYVANSKRVNPITRYKNIRNAFIRAAEKLLESMPEELYNYGSSGNNLKAIGERLLKLIDNTELCDTVECIEKLAIDFVAGILLDKTNYYKFLTLAENAMSHDDSLTMDDVIPTVLTEIITDYLLGNTKVFKVL